MSDPISVRHVIASSDITDRITKAEAATNQALGEEFAKELSRQDLLKQQKVVKKEESDQVEIHDDRRRKEEEEKRRKEAKDGSEETEGEAEESALPPATRHLIDLQV
jgi:hypothetical protein